MQSSNTIDPRLNEIATSLYRLVAKGVVIRDRKILLVKESLGWYSLPGGGVDHGEHPREALVREIQEEIGQTVPLAAVANDPLDIVFGHVIKGLPRVAFCYTVTVGDTFKPTAKELEFMWADQEMLNTIPVSPIVETIREKLVF